MQNNDEIIILSDLLFLKKFERDNNKIKVYML